MHSVSHYLDVFSCSMVHRFTDWGGVCTCGAVFVSWWFVGNWVRWMLSAFLVSVCLQLRYVILYIKQIWLNDAEDVITSTRSVTFHSSAAPRRWLWLGKLRSVYCGSMAVLCLQAVYTVNSQIHFPSVLWHCWLGDKKGVRPVKELPVGLSEALTFWLALCESYSSSCHHHFHYPLLQ